MKKREIPKKFSGFFWSVPIKKLNLQNDKNYIIHQILSYGDISQINWLSRVYPKKVIRQTFINHPQKNYHASSFNFIKNYILNIPEKLDENRYFKNTLRNTR